MNQNFNNNQVARPTQQNTSPVTIKNVTEDEARNEFLALTSLLSKFKEEGDYSYAKSVELDFNLAKLLGKRNNFNNSVHYPYNEVLNVMLLIDPTFTFEAEVKEELNSQSVNVYVTFTSEKFKQNSILGLAPMAGKGHNAVLKDSLTTRIINDTIGRSLAKNIAFNTGIGSLCWNKPGYVWTAAELNITTINPPELYGETIETKQQTQIHVVGTNPIVRQPMTTQQPIVPQPIQQPIVHQPIQQPITQVHPDVQYQPVQQTTRPQYQQVQQPAPIVPQQQPAPIVPQQPKTPSFINQGSIPLTTKAFEITKPVVQQPATPIPTQQPTGDQEEFRKLSASNTEFRQLSGQISVNEFGETNPWKLTPETQSLIITRWNNGERPKGGQ